MENNTQTSFPEILDSTMLNSFRSCPTQFKYNYIWRKRPEGKSVDLEAGGTLADALCAARKAFFIEGKSEKESYEIGFKAGMSRWSLDEVPEKKAHKDIDRVLAAYIQYFEKWPLSTDYIQPAKMNSKPAIEFSFAIPIDIRHPVTGNPLILAGRTDWIGEYNGSPFVVDEKTCSRFESDWASKWRLRGQFLQYHWAALQSGIAAAGCIVRGIKLLKTEIGFQEAICQFSPWEIERWYNQTLRDINRMISYWQSGEWDYNLGDACTQWGGCDYRRLCEVPNPEQWVQMGFVENTWNPLEKFDN